MKNLMLIFAIFALFPFAWADTVCTNASGELTVTETGYNRGVPPREGDQISHVKISYKGKILSESTSYQGLDPELGPINHSFEAQRSISQTRLPYGQIDYFSAKLMLQKNTMQVDDVEGIELPFSDFVICKKTFIAYP